jgi:hypothetical protein
MAGTFTHWMVAEEALDRYQNLQKNRSYVAIILGLNHFVCLGAVGPDYPYLTELLGNYLKVHSWADRMHYENTGDFVRYGIKNLLNLEGNAFNTCLAWLCGFATHLVTDSVIHPVVQAIVGPYIFNKTEHRHCELIQDAYIFHNIKGIELRYANYEGLFKMCSNTTDVYKINPDLKGYWAQTLKLTHPTAVAHFDKIDPDTWHKHFLSRLGSAAHPMPIFRHFEEEKDLAYKTTDEISLEERKRFIDQVRLPGNKTGAFKKDAFNKAVEAVIEAWDRLFDVIEKHEPDGAADYIKNWNLDTGVNEDTPYFWA